MDNLHLSPFLHSALLKIEVIMDAHHRCSSYANNQSLPVHIREEELRTLPLYRDILAIELELIMAVLFNRMDEMEGKSCHE